MSTPFSLTLAGKEFQALSPSFAFQKKNKPQMQRLMSGKLAVEESQDFMAEYITHCIQRVMPNVDVEDIESRLDAVEIAKASQKIGLETQKQVAAAYGVESLGEAPAGE